MNADRLLQVRAPFVSQYVEERPYPRAVGSQFTWKTVSCAPSIFLLTREREMEGIAES